MTILQHSIAQAAAAGGYQIARSLRFNSADSAYLNRTPASAGNTKICTFSIWLKLTKFDTYRGIYEANGTTMPTNRSSLMFTNGNKLDLLLDNGTTARLTTTKVYRDPSSFLHLVMAIDTTQATASNRIKLYDNGVQLTAFDTATYPALNAVFNFNNNTAQYMGRVYDPLYSDWYVADVRMVDGQQLAASDFGEFDANTGVWVPKAYTGTYGTNGFWLKLDDNSNNTAATLGKDSSGNGNNWTPSATFSVTAGVGNDSLVDTPTNYGTDTGAGGEVRGNYATLNPLKNGGSALSNGSLDQASSVNNAMVLATIGMQSGKWYWEVTGGTVYGIAQDNVTLGNYIGQNANSWGYHQAGTTYTNAVSTAYGNTWTGTDVIGVAFDADNGRVFFSKNGVWQNSGVPASGTNPAYSGLTNGPYFPAVQTNSGATSSANFGQRPFAYTAPSGFKALCTQNLPTPAIGASASTLASKNFNVVTYTGDGTSSRNITGVGFAPDFVWFKNRASATFGHRLYDIIRGATKELFSHSTSAEYTEVAGLTAFGSDGYTVGNQGGVNENTSGFVTWNWKANGAGVSNTAGSITSTVSANTAAGISVVTYTGNASTATVGHGLGAVPKMIIVKNRASAVNWIVYHASIGAANTLVLNSTAASAADAAWGSTTPTSSVFTVGNTGSGNQSGSSHVAYCFAEVAGFSKFGSYTGNGSADGPFVYCGFRPRWILIKSAGTANGWALIDTARSTINVSQTYLEANTAVAEGSVINWAVDILSNGFKIRSGAYNENNGSGTTYIFAAFAESPFNYARAR